MNSDRYKLTGDPESEEPLTGHQISHLPSVDVIPAPYFVRRIAGMFND